VLGEAAGNTNMRHGLVPPARPHQLGASQRSNGISRRVVAGLIAGKATPVEECESGYSCAQALACTLSQTGPSHQTHSVGTGPMVFVGDGGSIHMAGWSTRTGL